MRPVVKIASVRHGRGNCGAQDRSVLKVHGDQSTQSTTPLATKVGLRNRSIDYERLPAVYYVGLTQSITRAGHRMGLCQSAVTKQIKMFEERLGHRLFMRQNGKMILTPAGQKVFRYAENLITEAQALMKSLHAEQAPPMETINIFSTPSMANTWLPHYVKGFDEYHPHIQLIIHAHYETFTLQESGVGILPFFRNNGTWEHLRLFDQYQGLFASEEYLSQYGIPQTLEQLQQHKLIAINRNLESAFHNINWILKAGLPHPIQSRQAFLELPSNDAVYRAMLDGLGIASIPVHHVNLFKHSNVVRILPTYHSEPITAYFVYDKQTEHKKTYHFLYDYLIRKIHQDQDLYR